MGNIVGPRATSPSYKAIVRLVEQGGTMTRDALREFMRDECPTYSLFKTKVIDPLNSRDFINVGQHYVVAMAAGKDFVGTALEALSPKAAAKHVGEVATARMAPSNKPLDLAKHLPSPIRREGALDYRDIPSLMGGKRVARDDGDSCA